MVIFAITLCANKFGFENADLITLLNSVEKLLVIHFTEAALTASNINSVRCECVFVVWFCNTLLAFIVCVREWPLVNVNFLGSDSMSVSQSNKTSTTFLCTYHQHASRCSFFRLEGFVFCVCYFRGACTTNKSEHNFWANKQMLINLNGNGFGFRWIHNALSTQSYARLINDLGVDEKISIGMSGTHTYRRAL